MKVSFSEQTFKGASLLIATPMYGGCCCANYLGGMVDLFSACTAYKIPINLHGVGNESLLSKGRNNCVQVFLRSNATHLMFIDADVGFTAKDVLSLLTLMLEDKEEKYDVLAGPYPQKSIAWDKVKKAVEKGFAEEDPSTLSSYVGDYTFLAEKGKTFSLKEPTEVLEIATGFMLIPRRTFLKFMQAYPNNTLINEDSETEHLFFDCIIDPETKWYLAEDSMFCKYVRKMGGKVWLAPWLELTHQGLYTYQGSLAHLSKINMSPIQERK